MMKHGLTKFRGVRFGIACGLAAMVAATAMAPIASSAADSNKPMNAEALQQLKIKSTSAVVLDPSALGDFSRDTVYTAVTICRIINTRTAGGSLQPNVVRTFDVDGTSFTSQGGVNTSCGVPFGVASAVAMIIHPSTPPTTGSLFVWSLGSAPASTAVNFAAGQTIANTVIVPVVPGAGNDFSIKSSVATHVVVDVIGYFAAPIATPLSCLNAVSGSTSVPHNVYTSVDAICPTGYSVTGGGTFPVEGTLGRPNIWTDGSPTAPNGWRTWVDNQTGSPRSVQTYARCCRISGR